MIKQPYNIEIEMSAKLSPLTVKEMITREVEAHTGKKVTEVVASYQNGELDSYQVFFLSDNKKMPKAHLSKEFIKMKFDGE